MSAVLSERISTIRFGVLPPSPQTTQLLRGLRSVPNTTKKSGPRKSRDLIAPDYNNVKFPLA
jgi:hypothetical protein